jgi:hypothetical protein
MSDILSDDERKTVLHAVAEGIGAPSIVMTHWPQVARAVERAVVSRLAEMGGELLEPAYMMRVGDAAFRKVYTADQMRTERAKGVAAGMAQAAPSAEPPYDVAMRITEGLSALVREDATPSAEPSEPVAWLTDDGLRAVTAKTKAQMLGDGGAGASSMRPYCVPAYAAPPALPDGAVEAMRGAEHALAWLLAAAKGSNNVKIAQAALDALRAQLAQIGGGR